ncbi:MAG: GLUG motif-containing protein, partial [archaeon]
AFGKGFTNTSLDKTNSIKELSVSDAGVFVYPKSFGDGVLQVNYQPPSNIQEPVVIASYKVLEIPDMESITLSTPFTLTNNSTNILSLDCLYEYSLESPEMTIQLITEDNTYIDIKQRDPEMVCTSTGDGSEDNPKIICSAEDLNAVRDNLDWNYTLGKDIDLQCFSRLDVNGWVPIGNDSVGFTGIFNGNKRKISNLYINRPTTDNIGLFGYASSGSGIKNVGLEDVNISGHSRVGGLVGYNAAEIITNSNSTGFVSGYSYVGGLIGTNYGKNINYNYSEGVVYAEDSIVGGLIGAGGGNIQNNYSFASVRSLNTDGGLIGMLVDDAGDTNIVNNYSIGIVWQEYDVFGGLIGSAQEDSIFYLENNFWDINTSEIDKGYNAQNISEIDGKTTTEMKTQSTFTDWDFGSIWNIDSIKNEGYPYLINNPPR